MWIKKALCLGLGEDEDDEDGEMDHPEAMQFPWQE